MESISHFDDAIQFSDECYEKYIEAASCCDRDKKCCNCPNKKSCVCAKDVIESIALVEASLAHILNAEGEKLQKVVKLACTVEDLLKINKSVRSTLIHATFLEHTLFAKLETVCNDCVK